MTGSDSPDLPLVTLEELPDRRRDALLWRYALTLDYAGVDFEVRARSRRPCGWQWLEQADERVAVLGDDDRYHLLVDGQPVCVRLSPSGRRRLQRNPPAVWRHEQWCHWWTDGTRYLIQAPRDAARGRAGEALGSGSRPVRWSVVLTDDRLDPSQVPTVHRCPIAESFGDWPLPENPASALGRVRIRLIEVLGSDCHACRRRPGVLVDHDPFTTYVRGLLCRHCNLRVDICPHLRGCPWADYLNDPPAAPLELVYPSWRKVLGHESTIRKIQMLGIDPFADLRGAPPGDRSAATRRS